MAGLNEYKKTIYSQWGEDGIIEEIFNRIGVTHSSCIEFGAGDGYELSNVWHLIKEKGWKALLIDADTDRHDKWVKLTRDMPNVTLLKRFVAINGDDRLEKILEEQKVPKDLDLLSIDIDSDDYHIFDSLKTYTPRVVIIEHNPTVPPFDAIVQKPGEKESFGASAKALIDLAHTKGYKLVAATHTNLIFVHDSEFPKLRIDEPRLEDVFDWKGLTYVISSYNGSLYFRSENKDHQPNYGWTYDSASVSLSSKSLHSLTVGPTLNKPYSKTLAENYLPVRILRDSVKASSTFFSFCTRLFHIVFNRTKI